MRAHCPAGCRRHRTERDRNSPPRAAPLPGPVLPRGPPIPTDIRVKHTNKRLHRTHQSAIMVGTKTRGVRVAHDVQRKRPAAGRCLRLCFGLVEREYHTRDRGRTVPSQVVQQCLYLRLVPMADDRDNQRPCATVIGCHGTCQWPHSGAQGSSALLTCATLTCRS